MSDMCNLASAVVTCLIIIVGLIGIVSFFDPTWEDIQEFAESFVESIKNFGHGIFLKHTSRESQENGS